MSADFFVSKQKSAVASADILQLRIGWVSLLFQNIQFVFDSCDSSLFVCKQMVSADGSQLLRCQLTRLLVGLQRMVCKRVKIGGFVILQPVSCFHNLLLVSMSKVNSLLKVFAQSWS